ncbi:IS607 family transposase [Mitsuokella sp.]|uniref:IS607 family transposase n=1 Tax=Mitsuokella sp. TaxID=2049034 RepID=UPI003D7ED9C4
MFSKDVLRILQVSRPTLTKYVKTGIIRVHVMPNGHYDYNEEDVYKFLNKDVKRRTYIYARVSTKKQKKDLENQLQMLKQFCFANGYTINGVFSDIAIGISFEHRKNFFKMLDDVLAGRVERVIITYKDRLSRVGYELFYYLFQKYNCDIVVMNEVGSEELDSQEVFGEIVSLLHCYSMKLYSSRGRLNKIKEVLEDEPASGTPSTEKEHSVL